MTVQDAYLAAWRFAAEAHRAQQLPGTELPYLVHVGAVAMEVVVAHHEHAFARPELAVQCALLHDTLEDTATSEAELVARFGADVAAGVRALSKDKGLAKPEAMADSLRRIRAQPAEVWAVKLADRITNLAPPPAHWSPGKIAAYRSEARTILDALGQAHAPLAARLARRIASYPSGSA
ncbi:MAG TPA: HD domain-containing protein [Kofleriaceae bacterium]|nr:HD domain-containing protein [Kofleriaceae bacterium]